MPIPKYPTDVNPVDAAAWNAAADKIDANEAAIAANDLYGGITSRSEALADTGDGYRMLVTHAPMLAGGGQSTPAPGELMIAPLRVIGSTYSSLGIYCSAAATSGSVIYVMYEVLSSGHPGSLVWSRSFAANATGDVVVTGLSDTVPDGLHYCGVYSPSTNSGTPSIKGIQSGIVVGPTRPSGLTQTSYQLLTPGEPAPPASLSATLFGAAGTELTVNAEHCALLFGVTA